MALKNPTKLVVDFNADIKTDQPGGRSNLTRIIANSVQLPFSSYNVGSVDIDINDTPVVLGTASTCVIASSFPVDVSIDQSVITTKLFAYDGIEAVISVDTTSITPITVEYALGIKAPSVPVAPTIGTATAGDMQAVVTFTPPQYDGGRNISSFTVTAAPGNITATGTTSPILVTGLNNGTPYTFTVVATNIVGNSIASSASNSVVPAATLYVPSAPIIGNAIAGDAQAIVDFIAPLTNGGSVITGYTVTSNPGSITATGTIAPITVTGLTNGTSYTFTVTAANAVGTSIASMSSNSVTPVAPVILTAPSTPTITNATAGDTQVVIDFTAPSNNGGSAITGYTITSNDGITATGTASPLTVTGLTNGTAYTFTITATNVIGTSLPSAASSSVTPVAPVILTAPDAPTITNATAGDTQVVIDFTAPTNDGGSAITSYRVMSNDGITATGTASPLTVTGLTNGTAYTFTITATNAIGTSVASTASSSVTPVAPVILTAPDAPTISAVTAGNAQVTVDVVAPTNDGGSAITQYTVTSAPDNITLTSTSSPVIVTGLTNGTAYTFTATATNAIGTSLPSAASSSATPVVPGGMISAPGAPTITNATTGDTEVVIEFTAPTNDGGSAITGYTVTSDPDNITATGVTSPITVTGLTNGTAYTFTMTATNIIGTGAASTPSSAVTPIAPIPVATVPDAPVMVIALTGIGQADVTFTPPVNDGGDQITSYTVTSDPDNITATGMSPTITVPGLTAGTAYTFTVTATNAIGTSAPSASSNSITPA